MSVYFWKRTSMEDSVAPSAPNVARRRFPVEFKRKLVDETCKPGASVSAIALANGLNTNQLFAWRRQYLPNATKPALVSVNLVDTAATAMAPSGGGHIDIRLRHGEVRVEGAVCADTLRVVLASLR